MGIAYAYAAFMIDKKKASNRHFDRILTIGHQELCILPQQRGLLEKHLGRAVDASIIKQKYADDFLKSVFESKVVLSLDYSNYQQADIIHDMNYPIDPVHHETFDVVIDGGSIEHIFNFPVAIENYMRALKVGGCFYFLSRK